MLPKFKNEKLLIFERDASFCQKKLNLLLQKPNKNRMFNPNFKDNKPRQFTISKIIKYTCHILEYNLATFSLASAIFDSVLSKHSIDHNLYQPIALVCVCLASKIKESQKSALNLPAINSFIFRSNLNLVLLERKILTTLEFDMNIVTAFDFLSIFKEYPDIIFISKDHRLILKPQMKEYLDLLDSISILITKKYIAKQFNPLIVSLVTIMITRKLSAFQLIYPNELRRITNLNEQNLKNCFKILSHGIYWGNLKFSNSKSNLVSSCASEKNRCN